MNAMCAVSLANHLRAVATASAEQVIPDTEQLNK